MRFLLFFLTIPAFAFQFGNMRIPGIKKPAAPASGAADPRFTREFYDNIKNFSEGLYKQKERADFRLAVDRAYEEKVGEHARRAFETNISPHSEIKIILEDRFRYFTGLYDNLMIQELVNRIGQDVSPQWSEKLVTFKVLADPVPRAEALSTGTVYISTGLVAALDNKAQLAYVLAHEAAHVAKEHWKTRIMIDQAKPEFSRMKEENDQQVQAFGALIGTGVGALAGAFGTQKVAPALLAAAAGGLSGYMLANALQTNQGLPKADWNQFEEDEADEVALKSMLDAKVNVREVPNLYVAMDKVSLKDDRVGMGFWGNRTRMQERLLEVRDFLKTNVKDSDQLTGSDPDFKKLIAELKRDNGILAYHFDMLDMARANLEQAADVKNPDPASLYYYGKILQATAKTEQDRNAAAELFSRALQRDTANHAYGAYLHRATFLIDRGSDADRRQAVEMLEKYVDRYGDAMDELNGESRRLPPHMDTIVDYMRRAGVDDWKYAKKRAAIQAPPPQAETAPAPLIPVSAPGEQARPDPARNKPPTKMKPPGAR